MKYIRINNFYNQFNQPDYKKIDLKQIIAESQLYPQKSTYAVVATNEEFTTLPTDVEEITREQYLQERTNLEIAKRQNQADLQQLQDTVAELIKESLK